MYAFNFYHFCNFMFIFICFLVMKSFSTIWHCTLRFIVLLCNDNKSVTTVRLAPESPPPVLQCGLCACVVVLFVN